MKNEQAFTLIELLVVVLIIGILAAVALPQYQKAVEESKATQALTMLKSVYQAAEAYKMANGDYPTQFDELAVEIPWTGTQQVNSSQLADKRSNGEWTLELYNTEPYVYISSGRLTGKYKGAYFVISLKDNDPKKLGGKIRCFERTDLAIPFSASAGSYCKQIMKGIECESNGSTVYNMCYLP